MPNANPTHQPARILVTGGAGFIGSNFLLHAIPRFPEVQFVNLDKLTYAGNLMNLRLLENVPNYHFVHGDICDRKLVRGLFDEHAFTTVVHFAAESHVDRSIHAPTQFVETNVLGTVNLLEAARHAWKSSPHARFFHVSTDEVFGALGLEGHFDEETPYAPRSPYAASKAAADHFVRAYANTYSLPVIITNCSNNYGPYQFPEKLIPLTILRAIRREQVPVYGAGANVRDWLHVEDHCTALELVLRHGITGETYLIGGHGERSNLELVHTVLRLVDGELGRPPDTSLDLVTFVADRPGHDFRYAIDSRQLQDSLGWSPGYTLESGLRSTVHWYLKNQAWLDAVTDESYRDYVRTQSGA